MYTRILMPVDGSACAERAMEEGLRLAAELGAEVIFLHAVEDPLTAGYAAPESLPYAASLAEDLKKEAARILQDALERAEREGVRATKRLVEHRDPVDAIREAEGDADLVVMGTHGRRGVSRWIFGSVAEGALRRSGKPFLVVRSDGGSDAGEAPPAVADDR